MLIHPNFSFFESRTAVFPLPNCSDLLIMKRFVKLIKKYTVNQVQHLLNLFQFAYQSAGGVKDALLTLLNLFYKHLDISRCHANIVFWRHVYF